jgi:hypothetical protein
MVYLTTLLVGEIVLLNDTCYDKCTMNWKLHAVSVYDIN